MLKTTQGSARGGYLNHQPANVAGRSSQIVSRHETMNSPQRSLFKAWHDWTFSVGLPPIKKASSLPEIPLVHLSLYENNRQD